MGDAALKLSEIAIMDCQNFWVYCRDCGHRAAFWNLIKHTRRCGYAARFTTLAEAGHGLFDLDPVLVIPAPHRPPARR